MAARVVDCELRAVLLICVCSVVTAIEAPDPAASVVDPDDPTSDKFMKAIDRGDLTMLEELLKHPSATPEMLSKAPEESTDFQYPGYTVLHYACFRGEHRQVKMLLEAGADKDRLSTHSVTPLHVASQHGYHLCVRELLRAGADTTVESVSGMNAVTMAGRGLHLKVLKEYRSAGGHAVLTLGSPDSKGYSVFKYALEKGSNDIVNFIMFEVGLDGLDEKEAKSLVQDAKESGKMTQKMASMLVHELNRPNREARIASRKAYFEKQETELRAEKTQETKEKNHSEL